MNKNPLTPEHLAHLKKISTLDAEKQQAALSDFLKTLTPEQLSFLQQQQGGNCVLCLIAEKQLASRVLYEDDSVMAVLEIHPATKGHALVFPKQHFSVLAHAPEPVVSHLFTVSHALSSLLFDTLKPEGTNLFVANGAAAGQLLPHAAVHVIPRYAKDGVTFGWKPSTASDKELDELHEKLHGKISFAKKTVEKKDEPVVLSSSDEDEYVLP